MSKGVRVGSDVQDLLFDEDPDVSQRLAHALRPVQAPLGFSAKVMRAVQHDPAAAQRPGAWRSTRWVGAALAATLVISAGSGLEIEHRRRQRQEAERQFVLAMRVTSHALAQTRRQLSQAGLRLADATNN